MTKMTVVVMSLSFFFVSSQAEMLKCCSQYSGVVPVYVLSENET